MPVPTSLRPPQPPSYLDILSEFLAPPVADSHGAVGRPGLDANAPVIAAALNSTHAGEIREHAANDPGNPRLHALSAIADEGEREDPYSDPNVDARRMADQSAADVVGRFMNPGAMDMRTEQAVEHGRDAESTSEGTARGVARAAISPEGVKAAHQGGDEKIRELFAGQGMQVPPGIGGTPAVAPSTAAPAGPAAPAADPGAYQNPAVSSPAGQAALKGADPATAAIVKSILEYRMEVPGGYALARSPQMRQYVMMANQIDPTFDATKYEAGKKLMDSFTSGEAGQRLRSLNTASAHLLQLNDEREKMGNFNTGSFANPWVNWFEEKALGDPRYTQFDTTRGALEAELGKFLAGGGATNELRKSIGGGISSGSSDDQIKGYIDAVGNLMAGQYQGIHAQADALGLKHLGPAIDALLTPEARKVIGR